MTSEILRHPENLKSFSDLFLTSVLPLNHIGCHSHISVFMSVAGAQVSVVGIYCVRVDGVNEQMSGGGMNLP